MSAWYVALLATLLGVTGWLSGRWLIPRIAGLLKEAGFSRPNYAGEPIPVGAGFGMVVGTSVGWAILVVIMGSGLTFLAGDFPGLAALLGATSVAVLGFGLLGLFDDLVGRTGGGGFRGHFRALFVEGRLSTGAIKAFGGGILGLVTAFLLNPGRLNLAVIVEDGLLIALAANFINLLDLRPGRALKGFFLLLGVGLAGAAWLGFQTDALWPAQLLLVVSPLVGAAVAALPGDLTARFMLGDVGANALGASLGVLFSLFPVGAGLAVLLGLIVLTVLSERVSFSRAIEQSRVLRALDRWGRGGR